MTSKKLKNNFPIFLENPNLVYLDNSATTQKPKKVLDSLTNFYKETNANIHRGSCKIADNATNSYEEVRKKIANFINAKPQEIIFTSGTTDSLNISSEIIYYNALVEENSTIAVPYNAHHSLSLPFRRFFQNQIFYHKADEINSAIDIALITHVSNVTGEVTDPNLIDAKIKVLDCAQSINKNLVDVTKLGVDFIAFSAHKMYGPTGIGVLWVKEDILSRCVPTRLGGGIVQKVDKNDLNFLDYPNAYESGTPNIAGVIGLGAAIDFLSEINFVQYLNDEITLKKYLLDKLKNFSSLDIFTDDHSPVGIVSVAHKKIHAHDIATYLGSKDICVRAGNHCAQILHNEILKVPATFRVSLALYNDQSDIDKLIEVLEEAIVFFS